MKDDCELNWSNESLKGTATRQDIFFLLSRALTLLWEVSHLSSLTNKIKTQQDICVCVEVWCRGYAKKLEDRILSFRNSTAPSWTVWVVYLRVTVHFSLSLTSTRPDLAWKNEWSVIFLVHPDPSTGSHIILHLIRSDMVQSASSIALVSPSPPSPSRCLPMYHSFPLALCSLRLAVADCSTPTPSVGQSASSVFQPEGPSTSGLWRRFTDCCSEAFSKQLLLKQTYQRPTCSLISSTSTAVTFNESFLILVLCKQQ